MSAGGGSSAMPHPSASYEAPMDFEIVGKIRDPENFSRGTGIRELPRIKRLYGQASWRKRKGFATTRLSDGNLLEAESHWYEASGIGRFEFKIRRFLES